VVLGDRVRLVQAVQNLLDNAVKYAGAGGEPVVEVGSAGMEGTGKALFYVRDNGKGIPAELRGRLFELFCRGDPEGEGSGMGLAIARRIVEVHGGRIWADSPEGEWGTTFSFSLPVAPAAVN
jgi:signal transduction histidine kinase